MRWVEQECWRNLADFGTPAIAFGDGVCFVASDEDKVVFWSPTARHVVRVDERPVILCEGPDNSVLAVAPRHSWLLEKESPSPRYTFSSELAPLADNSVYAFDQGLFWYLTQGAGLDLVGVAPGAEAADVRLALDERWTQGPVIIYPHRDRLFCECALGQVSAWVLRDSEGFYLEGTKYCGPLLGFFGRKRVVWRPRGLCLCDDNGALSLMREYPKQNPLLSAEVLTTVIEKKQIGEDAIEAVLGEHVLVSAQGTPPPYFPWCAARHDGSLLAMHTDRLLRHWVLEEP